jgi:PST family polysaccharide transporter
MSVLDQRLRAVQQSPEAAAKPDKKTYGQILKSSAVIGSSSVLNIGFGIIRTKAMALLLGPTGVGLLGDYNAISDLVRTFAGMGVNTSGVRQIAEAAGTGDTQHLARTVIALRRVAIWSGALGGLLLVIFCRPISQIVFKDYSHAGPLAVLALAVFFGDISAGQGALVQGMRRIADLAKISVLGAFYGTIFSIPIVYFYREKGVVPSLVCVAGMGILTSWWYARKVKVEPLPMKTAEVVQEARLLLRMGVVFMSSTLMTMGVGCLIRILITRKFGIDAAGLYQSAWALGGLYIGFVLQAMGADFYPRLTAAAKDHPECNRLVNEQAEIGLLLAGPGVLGTLTFAPLVINLFYTAQFGGSVETFRWICLGMVLRVASWPMGFILLAKGERKLFFWSELLSNLVYLGLVFGGLKAFGLEGAGMAFFGLYVFYWFGIYLVVRRLSGFRWSRANRQLSILFIPTTAAVFGAWYVLPFWQGLILGSAATLICGIYSLKTLCSLIPLARLPRTARKMLVLFRLAPAGTDA